MTGRELSRRLGCLRYRRFFVDIGPDQIGSILRRVRVVREDNSDRFSDVAHTVSRQHRLPVGLQPRVFGRAELDGRNVADIGRGPYGVHAGIIRDCCGIDRPDIAMGNAGPDDTHMQGIRKRPVGDECPLAGQKRTVFQPQ